MRLLVALFIMASMFATTAFAQTATPDKKEKVKTEKKDTKKDVKKDDKKDAKKDVKKDAKKDEAKTKMPK